MGPIAFSRHDVIENAKSEPNSERDYKRPGNNEVWGISIGYFVNTNRFPGRALYSLTRSVVIFSAQRSFLGRIFALSFCLETLIKFVAFTASSVIEKVVWRREGVFGSFTLRGGVIMPPSPTILSYVTPNFEVDERNGSVTR